MLLQQLMDELKLRRAPVLLVSGQRAMPMTWGIVHPAILLPLEAENWGTAKRRMVLLHELAHVKRRDGLTHLLGKLAWGLHWFNPLAWLGLRKMLAEREQACDDLVVNSGTKAPDYAQQVLEVASRFRTHRLTSAAAIAMARPSSLEGRLLAILDRRRNRKALTWTGVTAMVLLLAIVIVPVAMLKAADEKKNAETPADTRSAATQASNTNGATTQPATQPATQGVTRAVEITVVDRDSHQPVADAAVVVRAPGGPAARGKTNASGKLTVSCPAEGKGELSITVTARPYANLLRAWRDATQSPLNSGQVTLELEKGLTIGGRVVDDAGTPIAGANVVIHMSRRPADHSAVVGPSYESVKTGEDGRWTYAGVPAQYDVCSIGCWHPLYISTSSPSAGFFEMTDYKDATSLKDGSATLTLKRGALIEGDVRDEQGKPIAAASIGLGEDRVASNAMPDIKADASGHFAIATHPTGTATVTIKARGYAPELFKVQMSGGNEKLPVEMKPAQVLSGRVVDAKGNPIPQAYIWIDTWRGCRTINATLRSDREGRFTWKDAPTDEVLADSEAPGFARLSRATIKAGEDNVLTLMPPAIVRGKVLDEQTGKPVDKFKVITGIDFGQDQRISWERERNDAVKIGNDGTFEVKFTWPYPGHKVRVEAEGYLPEESPTFKIIDGDQDFTFRLKKGQDISGAVVDASGKPVAGATVVLVTPNSSLEIVNGELPQYALRGVVTSKSGAEGRYAFPPQTERYQIVVVHDSGFAQIEGEALAASERPGEVKLQPWGRIEGQVFIGNKPVAEETLSAYSSRGERYDPHAPHVEHNLQAKTDASGRFVMPRVPPGQWGVGRQIRQGNLSTTTSIVTVGVPAGGVGKVQIGGNGRPVVGQVTIPQELSGRSDWQFEMCRLTSDIAIPKPNVPDEVQTMDPAQRQAWYAKWLQTEEGKAYEEQARKAAEQRRNYPVAVQADGRFRIEDVEAGNYRLVIAIVRRPAGQDRSPSQPLATASVKLTMPEIPNGRSDEPLTAPDIAITMEKTIEVGQLAPSFEVRRLEDGKQQLKLEDYRGKYVLLDFWAVWCGPCVAELPHLKAAYEAVGKDPRVVMISLSLDEDAAAPRKFVEKNGMAWQQAFLGKWEDDSVTKSYGIKGIPSVWLIGPDGKVLAKGLRGEQVRLEVEKALHSGASALPSSGPASTQPARDAAP